MLTPKTKALWEALRRHESLLSGFVLIGGTALSLQINHRLSEDLDFAFAGPRLPRERLRLLLDQLAQANFQIVPNDNPAALDDFTLGGEDLHDFHQDYLVEGEVKLTFVCLDAATRQVLASQPSDPLRVASIGEIFRLKCLVVAQRSKSRDWFDLYTLFTKHGFTLNDLRAALANAGRESQVDLVLARLSTCPVLSHDEGYRQLVENPPSLEEIAAYFRQAVATNEVILAKAAFERKELKDN